MTVENHAQCLYCQVVAGARPAEIVLESAATVAFLDRFPAAPGHTLVVPRRHAATLLQLDEGVAGALFGSVVEVVERLTESLRPAWLTVGWSHGAAPGRDVGHLHVHVLPHFREAGGLAAGDGPLEEIAEIIRGGGAPSGSRWPRRRAGCLPDLEALR